jgi:hypothetical protein
MHSLPSIYCLDTVESFAHFGSECLTFQSPDQIFMDQENLPLQQCFSAMVKLATILVFCDYRMILGCLLPIQNQGIGG